MHDSFASQSNQIDHQPAESFYCFTKLELDIPTDTPEQMLDHFAWRPGAAKRAAIMMQAFSDETALERALLRGLRSREMEAIARLLAIMVCAEESAIKVFQLESKRLNASQSAVARRQLLEIASEERVHDWLIQRTRQYFPTPEDLPQLRRRAPSVHAYGKPGLRRAFCPHFRPRLRCLHLPEPYAAHPSDAGLPRAVPTLSLHSSRRIRTRQSGASLRHGLRL